ncbi:MAG: InlB B-repeat-containing protein [Roseburia sp.]|nr:InlB B-repeat-containing protein [Roseburia sp.]
MKRGKLAFLCAVLAAVIAFSAVFFGCGGSKGEQPKSYTVVLDYGGAPVTGSRQYTVKYGESLPEVPVDLELEHKNFKGWFTEENCGGTQVADEYGLIPLVSVLNGDNFDLSGESVKLYAGFETKKYSVICHFLNSLEDELVQVEYDTPVSKIVIETRVDGNAVLSWSKTPGGTVFNGKITGDTDLYALEYAPVIDFDSNGGETVAPLVVKAGSAISLPVPVKELASFLYWQDGDGDEYNESVMPEESISLKAVWQAKLTFDENGGSEVNDISKAAGANITLPVPEKEGFAFAGWYTTDKQKYEATKMPSAGVALKAGWYQVKTVTKILVSETSTVKLSDKNFRYTSQRYDIDLSQDIENFEMGMIIGVKLSFMLKNEEDRGYYEVTFTNSTTISSVTTYHQENIYANGNVNYRKIEVEKSFAAYSSALYFYFKPKPYGEEVYTTMKDVNYTITYPDTSELYL